MNPFDFVKCALLLAFLCQTPQTVGAGLLSSGASRRQDAVGAVQDSCVQNAQLGLCQFFVCFSSRHPCDGSSDNYALDYGWRFCSRFDTYYERLNADAKRWLNGTRLCVMERLLNFYRAADVDCREVDDVMKDTQASCEAENGICTGALLSDNREVFTDVFSVNRRTVTQFLHGLKHCTNTTVRQAAAWFRETVGNINIREIMSDVANQAQQLRNDALSAFRRLRDRISSIRVDSPTVLENDEP